MTTGNRIRFIDAWRCVAVALVIIHHIATFSTLHVYFYRIPETVERLARLGRFGVLIFFCISGFVICRGMDQERSSIGLTLTAFYLRRALRILPPLIIYLTAIMVLSTSTDAVKSTSSQIMNAGAFVCNLPLAGNCGWFVGHTWTLAYEEQFYLVFPLLFLLLGVAKRPKILVLIVGLMGLSALLFNLASEKFLANYLTMFVYMLSGCAAALYWKNLEMFFEKTPVIVWLVMVVTAFSLAAALPFSPFIEQIKQSIVMPLLICFIVLQTPTRNSQVKAIFENPAIAYVGKISYTVYLWQELATGNFSAAPPWLALVLLSAVFLSAYFSYKYLERPLMKLGANWSNRIKGHSPTVAALAA